MGNKRTLFLSLGIGMVVLLCMFMPLWVVTGLARNNGEWETQRFVFSVFSTPFLIEKMPEKFSFLLGLFIFFIIIIIVFTILCIIGGLATYNNDSTRGKIIGTIGAIGLMLVFFAIMVIASFVVWNDDPNDTKATGTAAGWGEFPCIGVFGIAIPFICVLFSDSHGYKTIQYTYSTVPEKTNEHSNKVGVGQNVFVNTTVASLTGEIIPENTRGITTSKTIKDGNNVFFKVTFTLDDGRKVDAIVSEKRLNRVMKQ